MSKVVARKPLSAPVRFKSCHGVAPCLSTAGAATLTLAVSSHGAPSNTVTLPIAPSAFGLFTANGSGAGQGAILNHDGSYNSSTNPAAAGSIVSLYGTGEGGISPANPAGALVITTPYPAISQTVKVTVGGQPANIFYAGAAPLLPGGIDHINVQIPNGLQPGAALLVVTIGNSATTRNVTVAVR